MKNIFSYIHLFLFVFIFLFVSCGKSEIVVKTEYDFLSHLNKADAIIKAVTTEYVFPTFRTINDIPHWSIFQHPPSQIIYKDVFVGNHAALDFSIGMDKEAWTNPGDGVRFRILAGLPNETTQVLYSRYINPKTNPEDRKWFQERISINDIKNTTATFVLETLPGETDENVDDVSDWVFWGNPRLFSDGTMETHIQRNDKPNVILITLDTVRADYLEPYGNSWIKNPTLKELADKGVLFERAFTSMSTTSPAHASMLTSLYPYVHGVISNQYFLALAVPRLPQILLESGYKTGACTSVFHLKKEYSGMGHWFDYYNQVERNYHYGLEDAQVTHSGYTTTSAAIDWMEQVHNDPFFLWVHYYDAHSPYLADGEYHKMYYDGDPTSRTHSSMKEFTPAESWDDGDVAWMLQYTDLEFFKREYGAEITYIDSQIRRLLDAMKRLKVEENTIIVITADHGENFGEHHVYFDHWTLHESDIHVPLIVYYPERLPQGKRIAQPVSIVDISPTILDMLGYRDNPLASHFQGRSLKPLWEGKEMEARVMASEGLLYTQIAAWDERFKLIWDLRPKQYHAKVRQYADRVRLYDLQKDPREDNPIGSFYWRDPESTATAWDTNVDFQVQKDEIKIKSLLEKTADRIKNKIVPTEEVLHDWLKEQSEVNFVKKEYMEDPHFVRILVTLLQKLKDHAAPTTLKEMMENIWATSGDPNVDLVSRHSDDPMLKEFLENEGYFEN